MSLVVAADGDDPLRVGADPAQPHGIHRLMEDVLGVGGHGVGDAGQGRGDPCDPARQGREVRVQVRDGVPACLTSQLHALSHLVTGKVGQHRHDGGEALAVVLAGQAVGEPAPHVDGPYRPAHPVDPGGHPGDLGVEARVRGRAQRVDTQVLALGLAGEDLGDDEGL